jgi:AcrR family transcriptional regulator
MKSPQPPSLRDERRADEIARRRADALAAAASVFAAKGYHDAQITEIASAAELSRASLYSMFDSKEEIYQEAISTAAIAISDAVRSEVECLDDPAEQLLCVIDSLFSCFQENRDLLRIYAIGTHGLPFKIRDAMGESPLQTSVEFTDWVVGLSIEAKRRGYLPGQDPEAVGVSLVGAVTTRAVRWIESAPDRPLSNAAPAIRAIFRQLLGDPGKTMTPVLPLGEDREEGAR